MRINPRKYKIPNFFLDSSIIVVLILTIAMFLGLGIYKWISSLYKTLF